MNKILLFCLLFVMSWSAKVIAQTDPQFYDYPQNHLPWFTVESEHFMVHFQEGNSRSAQVVSRIAEEIYSPITELYQHKPDTKVNIVLKDREDYSNGAAYFFDNKIDIWVPSLDTPLRGTKNWMRNVITHEFVHIVQIQAAMKRKRSVPVMYFQWLSYEKVRRPDVLYGFPNGLISLPFASINVPAWLAEGTSQYQISGLDYDTWDSHRDMILRTRILSNTYFTLEEMGTFSSKTSIERETVYSQGYAFTIYLAERFGDDVLRRISVGLAEKGVYTVEEAIEFATGIPGEEIFDNWIAERTAFYEASTAGMDFTTSENVEPGGFFNFYPRVSPDGKSVAYLSNKGRDHSSLSLYIKEGGESTEIANIGEMFEQRAFNHADAIKPAIPFISTAYSFSPDGTKIVFAVNKKNELGEDYRDLFTYNLATKKQKRLTNNARIESPAWSPDGLKIAAIQYSSGTQNLIFIDLENSQNIIKITDFNDAETMFTPVWLPDGSGVYFAYADFHGRNIRRYDLETGKITDVLANNSTDYRDPFLSEDGMWLYYSSNPDGIFNIYRQPVSGGETEKITQVLGGAFMPYVSESKLYFSEYEKDGYKIKMLDLNAPANLAEASYTGAKIQKGTDDIAISKTLNNYDDTDIDPFSAFAESVADTGIYEFEIETLGQPSKRTLREYTDTFLDYSFYPVLRFDNYTKLYGSNGALLKGGEFGNVGKNLLRDMKPGIYFFNRDVIDKLTLFGGLMLGLASKPADNLGNFFAPNRLISLDRDLFFTAEYRGLPFIKRSWSPTVAVELFNIHRGVKDGLSIEEFPCTSCLPDTTTIDIDYEVWEANLFFRSKLSRRSLLELGIGYSPYQVSTDNFYSRELKTFISGSASDYFKGTTLSAAYTFDYYTYTVDADIAPIGLKGYLRYQYQPSKLLEEYVIKEGSLVPVFKTSKNQSTELHVRYGFKTFGNQAFQARVRGFSYFNDPKDSFYSDYVGGFLGMRSYPFYAIAGNTTAFTSLSWFMPIFKNMRQQVGPYMFDKVYARFFFETGNGWFLGNSADSETAQRLGTGNNLKSGIGAELRLASNGYYLFPLKFFISATYGFNEFSVTLPDAFITGADSNRVTYGREVLFHFGLTFDFEIL
jgi:Tol biopolymer transport system component